MTWSWHLKPLEPLCILSPLFREQPFILLAGYSSYPRKLNFAHFKEIADEVGAILMVDMAHFAGLVAGKVFQGEYDPVPYADIITSTTHKTLRGPRGGIVLCKKHLQSIVDRGCPMVLGGPLPHVISAKAIAFEEARASEFSQYAHKIVENAQALAEELSQLGLNLVTGGTDNHLLVLDLSSLNITGRQAESALREAFITVNRNSIPNDPNGPWYTTGVRIGTSALTTLGMGVQEMKLIASSMYQVLSNIQVSRNPQTQELSQVKYSLDPKIVSFVQQQVKELLQKYPLYPDICVE